MPDSEDEMGVKKTQLAQGHITATDLGGATEGSEGPGNWSQDGAAKKNAARSG